MSKVYEVSLAGRIRIQALEVSADSMDEAVGVVIDRLSSPDFDMNDLVDWVEIDVEEVTD
jgi:hypothetical protein